jgi:hypothetical protein
MVGPADGPKHKCGTGHADNHGRIEPESRSIAQLRGWCLVRCRKESACPAVLRLSARRGESPVVMSLCCSDGLEAKQDGVQQAWRPESDGMFARRAQPSPDGREKRGLVKEPWIEVWRSLQRRSSAGQGGDDKMR